MAIGFDQSVAFDSALYTFEGELVSPAVDTSFRKAFIDGPDQRLTIRTTSRVAYDQNVNAAVRE